MDDRTTSRAHSHAVILDEFSRINADIDSDIMAASMKDQYFGDVSKLQQRFDTRLRKLARRWHVRRSSFSTGYINLFRRTCLQNIAPMSKTVLTGPPRHCNAPLAPCHRGL